MSERERWIVYPLLFFALGASLRDKIFAITTSKRIVCEELVVVSGNSPTPLVKMGRIEGAPSGEGAGYLYLDGDMKVERTVQAKNLLAVDLLAQGTVNANAYAYRGVRYVPVVRGMLPGISPAELMRALQESARAWSEAQSSGRSESSDDGPAATDEPTADEPAAGEQPMEAEPAENGAANEGPANEQPGDEAPADERAVDELPGDASAPPPQEAAPEGMGDQADAPASPSASAAPDAARDAAQ